MGSKELFKNYNIDGEEVLLLRLDFLSIKNIDFPLNIKENGYDGIAFVPLYFPEHLELIKQISGIKHFEISVNRNVEALNFIHDLDGVEEVFINLTDSKLKEVDFSNILSELQYIKIYQGYPVGLENSKVEKLSIGMNFNAKFDLPTNLEYLHLSIPGKDVSNYPISENVKELLINAEKLELLSGIEHFKNVEKLELYSIKKLENLNDLLSLSALKKINFAHCEDDFINDQKEFLLDLNKRVQVCIDEIPISKYFRSFEYGIEYINKLNNSYEGFDIQSFINEKSASFIDSIKGEIGDLERFEATLKEYWKLCENDYLSQVIDATQLKDLISNLKCSCISFFDGEEEPLIIVDIDD